MGSAQRPDILESATEDCVPKDFMSTLNDATDKLYKSCQDDLIPSDEECLRTFMFDRCLNWLAMTGLYQGLANHISGLTGKSFKEILRKAAAEGRPLDCVFEIYMAFQKKHGHPGSGYFQWFQANRGLLDYSSETPTKGTRVRLQGLTTRSDLNSALGVVLDDMNNSGRFPVKVVDPVETTAAAAGQSVLVRPSNLQIALQKVVIMWGKKLWEVSMNPQILGRGGERARMDMPGRGPAQEWLACPIPQRLGFPLVLLQVAPGVRESEEWMALFLLADERTSEPSEEVRRNFAGGPVMVARTDNRDFSVEEMENLHSYTLFLVRIWPSVSADQKARALVRQSYENFIRSEKAKREGNVGRNVAG